ncbi:MAG: HD domain-containing phosphohydrolase [Thermodesulfobacteriota bacterium]|nr:HD domain-containing phosphohydrolase [Thermodesulfobacteriota bacterium]
MLKFRNLKGHKPDGHDGKGGPDRTGESADFRGPGMEPDQDTVDRATLDEKGKELYREASDYCKETFAGVRRNTPLSVDECSRIIHSMVETFVGDSLYSRALHGRNGTDFLVSHSANVAVYSIKMGEGLGFSKEKQVELGMAGLLHDVGKCMIPEEVLYKQDRLSDEEFRMVREAPNHGYDLLRSLGREYAYLAECCLQVYERIDGSGYPKGLEGGEIHEYAQIIGLVDFYEALTHSRPQREKFLHFAAVKEIINSGKTAFQRHHLKALLRIFSIFPLDSYVKLNSNAVGRVTQTYLDQPMRPRLQIISDSQGSPVLTEQVVNLPEHPLLYIVDSVSEAELAEVAAA